MSNEFKVESIKKPIPVSTDQGRAKDNCDVAMGDWFYIEQETLKQTLKYNSVIVLDQTRPILKPRQF